MAYTDQSDHSAVKSDEQANLTSILNALPIAVVAIGKEGQIAASNDAAAALFDVSLADLNSRKTHQIFENDDEGNGFVVLRDTGLKRPVELTRKTSIFVNVELEIISIVPIDQGSELLQTLKKTELKLLNKEKEIHRFLGIASHDLKAPLRRSKSFIELISKNYQQVLDERGQDWFKRCVNNLAEMQTLIDDLTTFSAITTKTKSHWDCCIRSIVEETFSNLRNDQHPSASIDIKSDLPTVSGDEELLRLLFRNLFDNSLTYNQDPAPSISLKCDRIDDNWQIEIRDNGLGVEEKYRDSVFDFFRRLHSGASFPGNGLGLAISQRIANHHDGNLSLALDQPAQGSAFLLTLPAN